VKLNDLLFALSRRFCYRRLFLLLRRKGEPSGINRTYQLSREDRLSVRRRRDRGARPLAPALRSRSKGA